MNFRREMTAFRQAALRGLREDSAWEDITSRSFVSSRQRALARLVAREPGIASGVFAAAEVFRLRDHRCRARILVRDGVALRRNQTVLEIKGPLRSLLAAERTALNLVSHLSGVATLTNRFVREVPARVRVLDTRKTLPGLRSLQKWAVRCGGGTSHRAGLNAVLIKENHLEAIRGEKALGRFFHRVRHLRKQGRSVEMECRNRREILWGLFSGADILLLDNFTPRRLRVVVEWIRSFCRQKNLRCPLLEVSGGISLKTIRSVSRSGVDRVSIGRLTHSAPALDFNMDVVPFK